LQHEHALHGTTHLDAKNGIPYNDFETAVAK
jgi:hypothetical protein